LPERVAIIAQEFFAGSDENRLPTSAYYTEVEFLVPVLS